jgi:hypothetical protein
VAAFRHLADLTWADFKTLCRSSPATCPSWRTALPWSQLEALESNGVSEGNSLPEARTVSI